jgi:hypothetical protein
MEQLFGLLLCLLEAENRYLTHQKNLVVGAAEVERKGMTL